MESECDIIMISSCSPWFFLKISTNRYMGRVDFSPISFYWAMNYIQFSILILTIYKTTFLARACKCICKWQWVQSFLTQRKTIKNQSEEESVQKDCFLERGNLAPSSNHFKDRVNLMLITYFLWKWMNKWCCYSKRVIVWITIRKLLGIMTMRFFRFMKQ